MEKNAIGVRLTSALQIILGATGMGTDDTIVALTLASPAPEVKPTAIPDTRKE
jgi:hypothetical protein